MKETSCSFMKCLFSGQRYWITRFVNQTTRVPWILDRNLTPTRSSAAAADFHLRQEQRESRLTASESLGYYSRVRCT